MDAFGHHSLPVLLILLPVLLAWRAWVKSDSNLIAAWRRKVFSTALWVTAVDVALTSGLWFYFWAMPFAGIEVTRLALLFGLPISCVAIVLLIVGRGKGWWLAAASPTITLSGWMFAYRNLSR